MPHRATGSEELERDFNDCLGAFFGAGTGAKIGISLSAGAALAFAFSLPGLSLPAFLVATLSS